MKLSIKKYKKRIWLLIAIIALIITFFIDTIYNENFYIEFLGYENLEEYKKNWLFLITPKIINISYNVSSILIIGLLISSKINDINRKELKVENSLHEKIIDKKIDKLIQYTNEALSKTKTEVFKSVFGLNVDPQILSVLETELFKNPTVRKDMKLDITFSLNGRTKDKYVTEDMFWEYTLINRLDKEYIYTTNISTTDIKDKVILNELQISIDGKLKETHNPARRINEDISKHRIEFTIPANSSIKTSSQYSLNFGMKDEHYQNAVGISEFTIGTLVINIKKPKGYKFTIELYSKNNQLQMIPFKESTIEETHLKYQYPYAIFPGTGIEYTLEKVD